MTTSNSQFVLLSQRGLVSDERVGLIQLGTVGFRSQEKRCRQRRKGETKRDSVRSSNRKSKTYTSKRSIERFKNIPSTSPQKRDGNQIPKACSKEDQSAFQVRFFFFLVIGNENVTTQDHKYTPDLIPDPKHCYPTSFAYYRGRKPGRRGSSRVVVWRSLRPLPSPQPVPSLEEERRSSSPAPMLLPKVSRSGLDL